MRKRTWGLGPLRAFRAHYRDMQSWGIGWHRPRTVWRLVVSRQVVDRDGS